MPFYKERFVSGEQVFKWFKWNNYFNSKYKLPKKKNQNFIQLPYCPELNGSGVVFVGSGHKAFYLKYVKYCTVKHRIIIELGKSTETGWFLGVPVESKENYDHVTEPKLRSVCDRLNESEVELVDVLYKRVYSNYNEVPRPSYINSIKVIAFKPPYVCLDLTCEARLHVVNLIFKLSQLLDCPMQLIDDDRYELQGFKREHCLHKSDIYPDYIMAARAKYDHKIFRLLSEHKHKEALFPETHTRYLLYV